MPATVTLHLDKRTTTKHGHPIKLSIYFAGKQFLVATKIAATEKGYQTLLEGGRRTKHLTGVRSKLDKAKSKAQAIVNQMGNDFSLDKFRRKFYSEIEYQTKGSALYLVDLYNERMHELQKNKQFKYLSSYKTSLKSLSEFKPGITLQDCSVAKIREFEHWVLEKGNSLTTVYTYLRPLRAVYKKAIDDGIMHSDAFPFGRGKYVIGNSDSARRALLPSDIKKLWEYKPGSEAQRRAIDYWFFSFHGNGIAPIDIANLKKDNLKVDHIVYQRRKTKRSKHKPKDVIIYLSEDLNIIIDRQGNRQPNPYLFPIFHKGMSDVDQYKKIEKWKGEQNKILRRVGVKLGLQASPCLYSARHSFADTLGSAEVNVKTVADALGQETITMALNYMGTALLDKVKRLAELTTLFKDSA